MIFVIGHTIHDFQISFPTTDLPNVRCTKCRLVGKFNDDGDIEVSDKVTNDIVKNCDGKS